MKNRLKEFCDDIGYNWYGDHNPRVVMSFARTLLHSLSDSMMVGHNIRVMQRRDPLPSYAILKEMLEIETHIGSVEIEIETNELIEKVLACTGDDDLHQGAMAQILLLMRDCTNHPTGCIYAHAAQVCRVIYMIQVSDDHTIEFTKRWLREQMDIAIQRLL